MARTGFYRSRAGTVRCKLGGYRLHHGLVGAWLAALGFVLALHDRRDWPWFPSKEDL